VRNEKGTGRAAQPVGTFWRRNKSLVPPGNRSTIPRLPACSVATIATRLLDHTIKNSKLFLPMTWRQIEKNQQCISIPSSPPRCFGGERSTSRPGYPL